MHPGALYFFKSVACSNTVYFEDIEHTKIFLELANQHLKDYILIHEYMLCKDGWVFVGRLKSEEQIQKSYAKKRERHNKPAKKEAVWKIISEQMRLFIGGYVTKYNASTRREGGLVKRSYERYFFETKREALGIIKRLRRRIVGLQQARKRYRAKKGHYRIPKKFGKGGIYLSSRRDKRRDGKSGDVKNMLDLTVFQHFRKEVLTKRIKKLIKFTKSAHNIPIPDS